MAMSKPTKAKPSAAPPSLDREAFESAVRTLAPTLAFAFNVYVHEKEWKMLILGTSRLAEGILLSAVALTELQLKLAPTGEPLLDFFFYPIKNHPHVPEEHGWRLVYVNHVALFERARALVAAGWTQKAVARNAQRAEVSTGDAGAACFCAFGALLAALKEARVPYHGPPREALYAAAMLGSPERYASIEAWNDAPGRTIEDVLAAFDRAIATAAAAKQPAASSVGAA